MAQAWPYVRPRCRSVPVFRATCPIPGSRGPIPPTNSQQNDQEDRLPSGNRAPDLHFLVAGRDINPRLLGYEPSVTPHNPVRQPGHQSPSPCGLPLPRRQLRTQRAECLSTPTDLASSPEFNFTRPPTAVRSCRHVAGHPAHPRASIAARHQRAPADRACSTSPPRWACPPVIAGQSMRLSVINGRPERRSDDGQVILKQPAPVSSLGLDLLVCGAPLRNRTVDLLLTMDHQQVSVIAAGI